MGEREPFNRPFKQWHRYFLPVGFVWLLLSLYSACQHLKAPNSELQLREKEKEKRKPTETSNLQPNKEWLFQVT